MIQSSAAPAPPHHTVGEEPGHRWGAPLPFRRRTALGGDRGSATAELAAGLPALLLLLFVALTAVGAVSTRMRCVDAARDAALAAARGDSGEDAGRRSAPDGADITVTVTGDTVTAVVRAPVRTFGAPLPAMRVEATAVAVTEPGGPAGTDATGQAP